MLDANGNGTRSMGRATIFILLLGLTQNVWARMTGIPEQPDQMAIVQMNVLPASFIVNQGQIFDTKVRYILQGRNTTVYLTDNALVFRMSRGRDAGDKAQEAVKTVVFKMTLARAEKTTAEAAGKLPGVANYFIGSDKSKWHTMVPTYAQVRYENVYPGVDMVVWGSRSKLKYEFHIAPNTDPNVIKIEYSGTEALSLDDKGNLHIPTGAGTVIDQAPYAYQDSNGQRTMVDVSYQLIDKNSCGFSITGKYDKSSSLTIDPDLLWSTFLGGSGTDEGKAIAIDSSGNVYLTGYTQDHTIDFPTTPGAYDQTHNGSLGDVFVSKLDSSGSNLIYSTFIGGGGIDVGYAIAVDSSGCAYVTGECDSGFPTTSGAYDTNHNAGLADAFIVKLNSDGSDLAYSTLIGGGDDDRGYGIQVDGSGDIYVTGKTVDDESTDFPTTDGAYDETHNGNSDVFVVKLGPDGMGTDDLLYSTFIGGSGNDYGYAIAILDGDAFITGCTEDAGTDFPITGGAYDTSHNGDYDVFVAQVSTDGNGSSDLEYSTFLGGNETDHGRGIAVDSSGDVYVTGETEDGTTDFPVTGGAYDETHNGDDDVFVAKVSPDSNNSSDLLYSTFVGGSAYDYGYAIAITGTNAFVTGKTYDETGATSDFPVTSGAYDETHNGWTDAFVCALTNDGDDLYYSTFLGGSHGDQGSGVAVDSSGNAYVTGGTFDDPDFPTTVGAYDTSQNGGWDVFACKLAIGPQWRWVDLYYDGKIDFADFAIFALAWRTQPGDDNWNDACDVSDPSDDVIDERDLAVFTGHWLGGT